MDSSTVYRILWAVKVLLEDAVVSNRRFIDMVGNFDLWGSVSFLGFMAFTYSVVTLSAYLLTYKKNYILSLVLAEVFNICLILATLMVPSRAFRFFLGIQSFSYIMIIHAKVFEIAYATYRSSRSKRPPSIKQAMLDKNVKMETVDKHHNYHEFKSFLNSILSLGVSKHVKSRVPFAIWPSTYDICFFFAISFVGDICSYLLREYVPYHISPENISWAMSLVGSLWQCIALEFGYYFILLFCHLKGMLLPTSLTHKNPLLSTTIGEFWGIRWNPVIGKQLQDCYYKPLRILGAPRLVGMLGTFLGSALIHAVPALISSDGDLTDCYSMFYFFFCQGISIITEVIILFVYKYLLLRYFPHFHTQIMHYKKELYLKHSGNTNVTGTRKGQTPQKEERSSLLREYLERLMRLKNYHFIELLAVGVIIYLNYGYYEIGFNGVHLAVFSVVGAFVLVNVVQCYHENIALVEPNLALVAPRDAKRNKRAKKKHIPLYVKYFVDGGIVVGWVWTVTCMLLQLPFFITPMMKVINEFYSQSFAIGPLIRTVEKFMYFYG